MVMTIPYGPTPEQVGDLLIPDGGITAATPKLLLIHGGGWRSVVPNGVSGDGNSLSGD